MSDVQSALVVVGRSSPDVKMSDWSHAPTALASYYPHRTSAWMLHTYTTNYRKTLWSDCLKAGHFTCKIILAPFISANSCHTIPAQHTIPTKVVIASNYQHSYCFISWFWKIRQIKGMQTLRVLLCCCCCSSSSSSYYYYLLLILICQYLACRKPKLRGQLTTNVTVRQTSNDCANKKACCLKVATDGAVMPSVGRLFHTRGSAALNARSPIVQSRMRRTASLWVVADHSRLREMSSSAYCKSLARYSDAVWLRQRNTRTAKRNWMRSGTRSQCKLCRSGVIRSYLRLLYTSLAAALSTDCRRSIRRLVMPLSVTLS